MTSNTKSQSRDVDSTITFTNNVEISALEFGEFLEEVNQGEVVIFSNLKYKKH